MYKNSFLNTQCLDYKDLKIIILVATPDSMKNEYLLIKFMKKYFLLLVIIT